MNNEFNLDKLLMTLLNVRKLAVTFVQKLLETLSREFVEKERTSGSAPSNLELLLCS